MTSFIGNIYEATGTNVTKYYYAGASRVALRNNGTLYFLLTDNLGSTTATTDGSGNLVSELRYSAWGEVRSGSSPSNYTYTGQYSSVSDFGLMYYNARWYDPSLGRFAQADTVVPGGVQGYDRYAYANNNPVNYTDPTGHFGKNDDEKSDYKNTIKQKKVKELEEKWEAEKQVKLLEEQVRAELIGDRQALRMEALLGAPFGSVGALAGGAKPLFDPPPPVHNDANPNIIRLPGVWQPGDTQTLDPLGKGAVLAFMAMGLGELYAIGGETAPAFIGIPILAVAVWGTMSWWNIAQTPEG